MLICFTYSKSYSKHKTNKFIITIKARGRRVSVAYPLLNFGKTWDFYCFPGKKNNIKLSNFFRYKNT